MLTKTFSVPAILSICPTPKNKSSNVLILFIPILAICQSKTERSIELGLDYGKVLIHSKAIENVKKAKETIEQKMPIDIVAIFIKDILEDLGKITGEVVTEDIIEEIFANFCLGK